MASIEFINKRIAGKEKEIEKLTKKLERIQKAQATGWEINPYYYSESDLRWTMKDLEAARQALDGYKADLEKANDKAASRNVPAITEFLDKWKERARNLYMTTFEKYPQARKAYEEEMEQFRMDYFQERKMKRERFDEWEEMDRARRMIRERFEARFGFIEPYVERGYDPETYKYSIWAFDSLKLEKDLTEEYNRKYDFIIERTNQIVKVITDATNLTVGDKGDLNGYIIGTNGTAKVQTIGAGGYNIQCFHFRTLINRI